MDIKITGKVIKGDGYGRKIGFPTVNLQTDKKELPKEGVYAGVATLDLPAGKAGNKEYRAGIVIGPGTKIEAHLIGFRGNVYGKQVTLKINKFLREYKKFDTEEELIKQITKDISACK
jgi:FAD synthase